MLISVGQLIDQSVTFAKEHWKKFAVYLGVIILAALPYGILSGIAGYTGSALVSFLAIIVYIAFIVFAILLSILIVKNTKKLLDKQPIESLGEGLRNAKPLLWLLVVGAILYTLIVLGGLILLVIPGIIFMVWYGFYSYEVIFNNQRGMAALRESKKIVQGRWWSVVWRLIGPVLPIVGAEIGIFIVMIILSLIHPVLGIIFMIPALIVLILLVMPYATVAHLLLYQDLKAKPVTSQKPGQV